MGRRVSSQLSWSEYWQSGAEQSLQAHNANPVQEFVHKYFVNKLGSHDAILDIATGNGALLQRVPLSHQGLRTGIDYSEIAPEQNLRSQNSFLRMDGSCLGFGSASFDWVVSHFGFEYIPREAAVKELLRVLRPEAQVFLLCHRKDSVLSISSKQQLHEARLIESSGLFALAKQWCVCADCDLADSCELKEQMASLMSQLRLPRGSSLLFALLQSLGRLCTDVEKGLRSTTSAQQTLLQWEVSLGANISRLEQQLRSALSGADQKELASLLRAEGFKAKTLALGDKGKPLAWGMYFSRSA